MPPPNANLTTSAVNLRPLDPQKMAVTQRLRRRRPSGAALSPDTVSDYWAAACAKAGVKRIRLHDARHTCGTLMHLEHNVPVAIISAWLGHADTAFTMRTYVHNQPEKLALAAESISSWTRRKKSAQ